MIYVDLSQLYQQEFKITSVSWCLFLSLKIFMHVAVYQLKQNFAKRSVAQCVLPMFNDQQYITHNILVNVWLACALSFVWSATSCHNFVDISIFYNNLPTNETVTDYDMDI